MPKVNSAKTNDNSESGHRATFVIANVLKNQNTAVSLRVTWDPEEMGDIIVDHPSYKTGLVTLRWDTVFVEGRGASGFHGYGNVRIRFGEIDRALTSVRGYAYLKIEAVDRSKGTSTCIYEFDKPRPKH